MVLLLACGHTTVFKHVGRRYDQHFPELRDPPACLKSAEKMNLILSWDLFVSIAFAY